jgi:hypothetical protein
VTGRLDRVDALLRGRAGRLPWGPALACALGYGGVMGSFGGVAGGRGWQVVSSAVKLPMLLAATTLLALPSFFVANTLLGVRRDFAEALRAVLASQAGLAIVLAALAPLTLVWYASSSDYPTAILFNALMLAVASLGAQSLLRRLYRPLIARDRRHRVLLRAWMVLYAFVGIQLGWTLRPFLGSLDEPFAFFRGGEVENAYVIVARMAWGVASRR